MPSQSEPCLSCAFHGASSNFSMQSNLSACSFVGGLFVLLPRTLPNRRHELSFSLSLLVERCHSESFSVRGVTPPHPPLLRADGRGTGAILSKEAVVPAHIYASGTVAPSIQKKGMMPFAANGRT